MAYVRTRLGRWFYEDVGTSKKSGDPAIVLCHGLLLDGGMWQPQVQPLSRLGRVIVVDGPGHGKSEPPPAFSLEDHAHALVDALDAWGVEKAILIGLSWGGMLAMRTALEHPSRVKALVLLDTSAEPEPLAHRIKYRMLVSVARRVGLPPSLLTNVIAPIMFGASSLRKHPELIEILVRSIGALDRNGLARAAKAVVVHRTDILPKIPAIRVPTLVLCGRDDRATPPKYSKAIASAISGATLNFIEGAGHTSTLEAPELVTSALTEFVRAQL